MRNYSRFIPGEEIDAVQQWDFGAIDTAAQLLAARAKAREAQEDEFEAEASRQEAYQAGYAAGVAQGLAQAQAGVQIQMQEFLANQGKDAGDRLAQLFGAAQSQLAEAEQTMAHGVLELACELARQVLRREFAVSPDVVMPVLTEALELLGADCKSAVVRMNPIDIEALGEQVHADFVGMALTLRPDASVLQGGCLVESGGMVVDGSLDKRWQRAVASLGLESAWETPHEPD